LRRFAERLGDLAGVGLRVLTPRLDAELGRVDADHAVLTHAVGVEDAGDAAGLLDGGEEFLALPSSPIAESPTVPGQTGATSEPTANPYGRRSCRRFRFSSSSLASGSVCGEEQEVVDAVELLAVHLGGGGQFEHLLEADRRLLSGLVPLPTKTGPHRIVEDVWVMWKGSRGQGVKVRVVDLAKDPLSLRSGSC
jgi:hypothetical protein